MNCNDRKCFNIVAYQKNSDDESEEADGAGKDLHKEDLDEEHRVSCICQSSSRTNLVVEGSHFFLLMAEFTY